MMRLGKKNLGATAQQVPDALDKAGQGKPTPFNVKQWRNKRHQLTEAQDPKTATQFRNLLNKLNNKG